MARRVDQPQPGYYRRRMVKDGVWVPVLIFRPCPIEMEPETWGWIDRWPTLLAYVDGGQIVDADIVWTHLRLTTKNEYEYLLKLNKHARDHEPALPQATPYKAVNLNAMKPLF